MYREFVPIADGGGIGPASGGRAARGGQRGLAPGGLYPFAGRGHHGLDGRAARRAVVQEPERLAAARETGEKLESSIEKLAALDFEHLSREALEREVRALAP